MKLWNNYKLTINKNCLGFANGHNGLPYWQNRLFATIMLYFLPLSFVALIPGIIMSLQQQMYLLAISDVLAICLLGIIALSPGITITTRKIVFIAVLYLTSAMLLYYLGSFGPGLLYLLASTLFTVMIFPRKIVYVSMAVNLLICAAFGIIIHTRAANSILLQYSLGSWVAVSSNLIFLEAVVLFLLPLLFKGLQSTIDDLNLLKNDLKAEQQTLKDTLELVSQKNTELEQFAYMAAHDMQEPLRMISKFLEELDRKYAPQLDEQAKRYIYFATDGAVRMKRTITGLLDYSVAGKKQNLEEQVNVNSLLDECIALNQAVIAETGAVITWKDLPVISAEQLAMQQVFLNLVGNALKYRKAGVQPHITVSATDNARYWTFRVSDNGIGIDEKNFDSIFVVFKRLHSKEEYAGSGIGLAICKKIVERHRGRIRVESIPGKGTTFIFTIKKP